MCRSILTLLLFCLGTVPGLGATGDENSLSHPQLDGDSFTRWFDFIRPSKKELAYREIHWRPSLWDALYEARRTNKPILLWTMNGNPLSGCT
jgi:hypothetical protein